MQKRFSRFLGKSGCRSRPPPRVLCRPKWDKILPRVARATRYHAITSFRQKLRDKYGAGLPDGGEWSCCPKGHRLVPYTTKGSGSCDGCGARLSKGDQVMDCGRCNWYLCDACLPASAQAPAAAVPAGPPPEAAWSVVEAPAVSRRAACSAASGGCVRARPASDRL